MWSLFTFDRSCRTQQTATATKEKNLILFFFSFISNELTLCSHCIQSSIPRIFIFECVCVLFVGALECYFVSILHITFLPLVNEWWQTILFHKHLFHIRWSLLCSNILLCGVHVWVFHCMNMNNFKLHAFLSLSLSLFIHVTLFFRYSGTNRREKNAYVCFFVPFENTVK